VTLTKKLLTRVKAEAAIPPEDKIFYAIVNVVLVLFGILVLVPLINVAANSLSSGDAVVSGKVTFWPVDFSFEGYATVFKDPYILTGYSNTIFYTVVGTSFNMILTTLAAWPLSRKDLPGRNVFMMIFTFTMLFNGGMIPNYILIRDLNLLNRRLAMIIPAALSVYNMIIMRTFFQNSIPRELLEASQLDGCSEARFFTTMVIPLSKPVIAVITLYYAVGHWNAFFGGFLYLTSKELYPLQLILRDILLVNQIDSSSLTNLNQTLNLNLFESMKYALILVSCIPIWCIYPLVQKFFVKGVMVGAIKG